METFQRALTRRLLGWSIFSILVGFPLWLDVYRPIKNIGTQFIAWGLIDGLIAIIGASRRMVSRRTLGRVLWINTFLDIGYMLGGAWMLSKPDKEKQGHGLGILIQGGFLFFFDLFHAVRLRNYSGLEE